MTQDDQPTVSRRDVLLAAAVGAGAATLGVTPARADEAPTNAFGLVFESVEGQRKGIPGVMVSNGRDVAVTDAEGRYALPVTEETVIL